MMHDVMRLLRISCLAHPSKVRLSGCLCDVVHRGSHAGNVGYLVLDEADKMLSLGLQPQLDAIRAHVLPEASAASPQKGSGKSQPPELLSPQVALLMLLIVWHVKHLQLSPAARPTLCQRCKKGCCHIDCAARTDLAPVKSMAPG